MKRTWCPECDSEIHVNIPEFSEIIQIDPAKGTGVMQGLKHGMITESFRDEKYDADSAYHDCQECGRHLVVIYRFER